MSFFSYQSVKHLHMACAAASGSLFILRGIWMLYRPALLQRGWVRIAPHLIDTTLLSCAVLLAVMSGQYPFSANWLTAKLVALVVYIGLGTVALKRGRTRTVRVAAYAGAIAVFCYIGAVAFSKNPLIFL